MIARNVLIHGFTDSGGRRGVYFGDQKLQLYALAGVEPQAQPQWGYFCPGSLILARSILVAVLGDLEAAAALAGEFESQMIRPIRVNKWVLSSADVLAWVEADPARALWLGRN